MTNGSADDELEVVSTQAVSAIRPLQHFDVDDAFAEDDDDHDLTLEFTPAAIRDDLARHHSSNGDSLWQEDHYDFDDDQVRRFGFAQVIDPDASVSTLDIDGAQSPRSSLHTPTHTSSSLSERASSPRTPTEDGELRAEYNNDEASAGQFSEISLSESTGAQDAYPSVAIETSANIVLTIPTNGYTQTPSLRTPTSPTPNSNGDRSKHTQSSEHIASSSNSNLPAASFPASSSLPVSSHTPPSPLSPLPRRGHRPSRSTGPSVFEQVVSKTRPSFLPPKSREEDQRHLADWEAMMQRSRTAEEKRRKARQERRLAREKAVEESIYEWEKEIVPDWRAVIKKPALRKLWWNGVPTALRATMWERAVGNGLALSKDSYRTCLARAKRSLASGTFPTTTLHLIDQDITSTLPALHIFHPETGPLHQDLKDLLCAWVVSRSDERLGYTHGVAKIAAMLLINMAGLPQAFIAMRNLLERHCLRSFYGGANAKDDVEAYYRIFDTLLADGMPKIYFNFKQHQISPSAYLPDWLLPLFLDHLPFEACARIWDVVLLEGDAFLYRAALAMLAVLEPRLFFPDRKELLELLRGENKAALEVARRDGISLDGGKYEIYGVDEDTLWERIESMDEWWKESTWSRLIQRELPDL